MIAMHTDAEQTVRPCPTFVPLAPGYSLHVAPGLDTVRVEEFQRIVNRLPLIEGVRITPDRHRPGFHDLETRGGTFFFYVYPSRRRVMLLAAWFPVNDPAVS